MTLDELCRAVARLVVENYTFRDMVVDLQAQNKAKDEQIKKLEETIEKNK